MSYKEREKYIWEKRRRESDLGTAGNLFFLVRPMYNNDKGNKTETELSLLTFTSDEKEGGRRGEGPWEVRHQSPTNNEQTL